MPRYTYQNAQGRRITLQGDREPTLAELRRMFEEDAQERAQEEQAALPQGVLPTAARAAGRFGRGALELIGRPGEFVTGTIAGTLEKGLGEGLSRGWRALTEADLADSKIQESAGRILEEQGVLKDSPKLRAAAGFVGDVLLDPLSLLGAPGVVRKGLIKGATAVGAGEAATRVLTAPNRAFSAVTAPAAESARQFIAQTTIPGLKQVKEKFIQFPELVGIKGASSLDAQQQRLKADSMRRAAEDRAAERVTSLLKSQGKLSSAQETLLRSDMARALDDPQSDAAERIMADPQLANLMGEIRGYFDDLMKRERSQGLMPTTFTLPMGKLKSLVGSLSPDQQQSLTAYFRAGSPLTDPTLQRVATAIEKRITSPGASKKMLYDPATFTLSRQTPQGQRTKKLQVQFSTVGENYVPGYAAKTGEGPVIFKPFKLTLNEARKKNISLADALDIPGSTMEADITKILLKRTINSVKAEESLRYAKELADTYASVPGGRTLRASVQKELRAIPGAAQLADMRLPEAVATDFEKTIARMSNSREVEGLYTRGLKLFKALVTSADVPRYPLVNALGNFGNMYLAGMSPTDVLTGYGKAVRQLRGAGLDRVLKNTNANDIFKVAGLADADVYRLAREQNVIGRASGFASEFRAPDEITGAGKLLSGRYNPLNPENAAFRTLREGGQALVEDPAKFALFVHELKQGKTADQAALAVKKYLFDYGELTDFEKNNITGLIPFYTWTRKNVPLQLGSLLMRPARVSNQDRFVDLMDDLFADEQTPVDETLLPSRLTAPGTFRIGATGRGRLRLPIYDVALPGTITDEALSGSPDALLQMLNPAYRAVATGLFKRNLETGEDLRTGVSKATPAAVLLRQLGLPSPAIATPQGLVQSRLSKGLMRELPVPTLPRQLTMETPDEATWSPLQRLILSSSGVGGTEITPQVRVEGARERQRRYRAILNQLRDQAMLEALEAQDAENDIP
jgi:hypothetical protein